MVNTLLFVFSPQWCEARERFQRAANLMSGDPSFSKFMWGQFWSAHQRFFKYLCIAAKVKEAVRSAQEAVKMGKVTMATTKAE